MLEFALDGPDLALWASAPREIVGRALGALEMDADDLESATAFLAATLDAPAVRGTIRLLAAGREQVVELFLGQTLVATVSVPDGGDGKNVVLGALDEFPRFVAELTDLGPRPFDPDGQSFPLPAEVAEAYAGYGVPDGAMAELEATFDGVISSEALRAVLGTQSLRWTLDLRTDADGPSEVVLDVVDARGAGLWLLADGDVPAVAFATPVNSSAVWVLLSGAIDAALAPDLATTA